MIPPLRDLRHDPGRTALHRSLRVALVMPLLFAFGLVGGGDAMFALLVVELFSLMAPAGWVTGAIRLEAVMDHPVHTRHRV